MSQQAPWPLLGQKRRYRASASISPPPLRRKLSANLVPLSQAERILSFPSSSSMHESCDRLEIFSWNVNGIARFLATPDQKITKFFASRTGPSPSSESEWKPNELRSFLERHNCPNIVCLQEVKINPKDQRTQRALQNAVNATLAGRNLAQNYTAHFSLPRDRYNATGFGGKVYGVCTLVRDDFLQAQDVTTKDADWDLEGRVLITEISSWKLAIVNGYWVNGTINAYRSPTTGEVVGTRHDRKLAFHAEMLAEAKRYEGKGWHVILIGDMNVAPSRIDGHPNLRTSVPHSRNRQDFNDKFLSSEEGMNGVDTWRWFHGDQRGYTYHGEDEEQWGNSCDRVDLGIASRSLLDNEALIGAEIWETSLERGGSDHVPISVVLDVAKMDGS